jgi:hypothetical protein
MIEGLSDTYHPLRFFYGKITEMDERTTLYPELSPPTAPSPASPEEIRQQRKILFIIIGVVVALLIFVIGSIVFLLQPTVNTQKIANVFIIFMALESLVLMFTLVILIIQMSILINLLQNEIRPIITSTNETVNTLRGTANFLSDNLTEPVIRANEVAAGVRQFFLLMGIFRRSSKNK